MKCNMETAIDTLLEEFKVKVRARAFIQHVPEFIFEDKASPEHQEEFMDKYNTIVQDHRFTVTHKVEFVKAPEAEEVDINSEQIYETDTQQNNDSGEDTIKG